MTEVEALERQISDWIDTELRPSRSTHGVVSGDGESLGLPEWTPAADILETDDEYVLKVEVPGVRKEDVKVRAEDGVLTITGERRREELPQDVRVHRAERDYGRFERRFRMAEDADASKVSARIENGLLWVRVAKDKSATRRVEVSVR